jgi:hypothetical protein
LRLEELEALEELEELEERSGRMKDGPPPARALCLRMLPAPAGVSN